jgi:hypothetical protein
MKNWLIIMLVLAASPAQARTHVRIHKQAPVQPVAMPLAVVPAFAVAIDLIRRASCDPTIAVATGPDDPGFTSHPVGNYLIPAIYRSECGAEPKR